jgi:hypothetical protein
MKIKGENHGNFDGQRRHGSNFAHVRFPMETHATSYEDTLRAIGQGLENLGAVAFELECSNGEFVVNGECRKTTAIPNTVRKKSFFSLILKLGAKARAEPDTSTFHFSEIRFTKSDIVLLNRKGRALRFSSGSGAPDPHSLAHVLRMTGAYLDSRKNGLSKLSWHAPTLTLWEVNSAGTKTRKDYKVSEMYDFWVHQFKKRTPGAA